jgi:hypothetical protein
MYPLQYCEIDCKKLLQGVVGTCPYSYVTPAAARLYQELLAEILNGA